MRRFGMLIVYLVVATVVFIAVGTADLRSQARYAAKENGQDRATIVTPLGIHSFKAAADEKTKDANL